MLALLTLALAHPVLIKGARSPDDLQQAVEASTLAACFESEGDMIEVDVVVRGSGAVKKAKARGGSESLHACVEERLRGLTLPPADGTAKYTWVQMDREDVTPEPPKEPRVRRESGGAGLMGALRDPSVMSAGIDAGVGQGVGGLIGAKGTQIGSGGLGSRGSGLGAGGSSEGMGGLGTRGTGPGAVTESGPAGDPVILGALTYDQVHGTIRPALPDILACGEDQRGKVVIRFDVATDGSVSAAKTKSSTVGVPAVGECIAEVVLGLAFEPPKGGGIAIISYPFVFVDEEQDTEASAP